MMDPQNGEEHSYSFFQEPWWLETVAPGMWDEVVIKDQAGILARWPYIKKKKYVFNLISMPKLTQHLGPWIQPQTGKNYNILSKQQEILDTLVDLLPPYDFLLQKCHHSMTNWLPLYWKQYRQTTLYTYILHGIKDHDAIWKGLRENIRREVRKGQKDLEIKTELGIDRLYDVCKKTFSRQNKDMSFSLDLIKRIEDACSARNCGKAFFAQDKEGNVHAAIYVIHDHKSAYYLFGGGDPKLRTSGAHSFLIWEAIKYTSQFVDKFDFEGSMVKPIERFFRSFGAQQTPYFHLTHARNKLKLYNKFII